MIDPHTTLVNTLNYLESHGWWNQGGMGHAPGPRCLFGGIITVTPRSDFRSIQDAVLALGFADEYSRAVALTTMWNDRPGRVWEDVRRLLLERIQATAPAPQELELEVPELVS